MYIYEPGEETMCLSWEKIQIGEIQFFGGGYSMTIVIKALFFKPLKS